MAQDRPALRPVGRLTAFRAIYLGLFAYVVLSVLSLRALDQLLQIHFERQVARAVQVSPADGPVIPRIQARIIRAVHDSRWVGWGGVRVNVLVIGADMRTPIYLGGPTLQPPPPIDSDVFREASLLLPPGIVTVDLQVPLDSLAAAAIWVGFGALVVPLLLRHQRRLARREEELVSEAVAARDATAERLRSIQTELEKVQLRLADLEPAERAHAEEIDQLQREREALQARLRGLAEREGQVREQAVVSTELARERQALEDLLNEAAQDLETKEAEIRSLQERLQRAAAPAAPRGRARAAEALAKRLRTLYRNLEIDDRALDDIASLGDETLRLRAEESLKRLDDDPDTAAIRRKVGGLPPQLSIFELGFAGKGRIYYTRGRQRGFRILAVGGKASQKQDLEYLSRLSLD
jgi:hypothetical protein